MSDLPRGGEEVAQAEQAGVETVTRYQCSSCFLRYDTVTEFSQHDCDPKEHRIICDGGRCKQVCANRVAFVRHFAAEHTRKRAEGEPERVSEPCRVCNVKYRVGDELLRHWDTHGKAFHTNEKRLMTVVETPVEKEEEEAAADAVDAADAADAADASVDAPVEDDAVDAAPATAQATAAFSAATENNAAAAVTTVHVADAAEAVAATYAATPDNVVAASIPGASEAESTAQPVTSNESIESAPTLAAAAANGVHAASESDALETTNGTPATESTAKPLECHVAAAAGTSNADSNVAAASHTADASETTDEPMEPSEATSASTEINSCRKRGTTEEPTNGVDPKRTRMETRSELTPSTPHTDHTYYSGSSLHSSPGQQSRPRTPQLTALLSNPVASSTPLRVSTGGPGSSTSPFHATPSKPSSSTTFIPSGSGSNAYRAATARPSSTRFQPPPGCSSTSTPSTSRPSGTVHQYPSTSLAPTPPSMPRLSPNARATPGAYPPAVPTTANALANIYDSPWFRQRGTIKDVHQYSYHPTPRPAPPLPPTSGNSALVQLIDIAIRRTTPPPLTSSNPSIPELLNHPTRGDSSLTDLLSFDQARPADNSTPRYHHGVSPTQQRAAASATRTTSRLPPPPGFISASAVLLRNEMQVEQPRPIAQLEEVRETPATAVMPTLTPIAQPPQLPAVKAEAVDAAYPIPQIPANQSIPVMHPTPAASAIPLSISTTLPPTVTAPLRSVKQEVVNATDAVKPSKEALTARALRMLNEEAARAAVPAPATAATHPAPATSSVPPTSCSMPTLEAAVSPAPRITVKQEVTDAAAPTATASATSSAASPATPRVHPRLMQAVQDFTKSEAFAKFLTEAGHQTTSTEAIAAQAAEALAAAMILPHQDAAAAVEANKDKEQDDQEVADEHNESNEHGSDTASIAAGEESPILETKHRPAEALEEIAEEDQEQIPSSGSGHSGSESTAAEEAIALPPQEASFAEMHDEPMDTGMDTGERPSSSLDHSYAHPPPANEPMDDDFHHDPYEFDDEDEEDEVMPCRSGMAPDCDYVPGSDEERKLRRTARKKKRPLRTAKRESVSRCAESSDDENVVKTRRKSTVRFAPKIESGEEEEKERQPARQPAERSDAETTPRSILKSSPRKLRSNGEKAQQAAAADSDDEPGPSRKRSSRVTISSGDESSRSSSPRKKHNKRVRQAAASSGDEDVPIRSRSARRSAISSDDESAKEQSTRRSSPRKQKKNDERAQQPEAMSDDPSGVDEMATPPQRSRRSSSRKQIKNEPQSDESDGESEAPRSSRSSKRRRVKSEMESDEDEREKNAADFDAGVQSGRPRRSGRAAVKQEEMEEADRKMAEMLQGSDKRLRRSATVRLEEEGEENEEDQEFWSGKAASNQCPRCDSTVQKGSRRAHYRTFHYDAFFPLVPEMNGIDRWLSCRLGGFADGRICQHCTDGVMYDGKVSLLKHIKKVHRVEVFKDMKEAYRIYTRSRPLPPPELLDLHQLIT